MQTKTDKQKSGPSAKKLLHKFFTKFTDPSVDVSELRELLNEARGARRLAPDRTSRLVASGFHLQEVSRGMLVLPDISQHFTLAHLDGWPVSQSFVSSAVRAAHSVKAVEAEMSTGFRRGEGLHIRRMEVGCSKQMEFRLSVDLMICSRRSQADIEYIFSKAQEILSGSELMDFVDEDGCYHHTELRLVTIDTHCDQYHCNADCFYGQADMPHQASFKSESLIGWPV